MASITDARGRTLELARPPLRIVSLVPSLTESIAAINMAHNLVGVTRFCVEPAEVVRPLRKVGGTKNPDVDLIQSLRPEIVFANREENREEDVLALEAAGVRVYVGDVRTVRQGVDEFAAISAFLQGAQRLKLREEFESAIREQDGLNTARPRVRVYCPIWHKPSMAVSGDTYAGDMIRLVGGINVFETHRSGARYPQVSLEEVAAVDPEVIVLPDEPFRFSARHRAEFLALKRITAARNGHVFLCDGKWLSWYGPRIPEAVRGLSALLDRARPEWLPPAPAAPAPGAPRPSARERARAEDEEPAKGPLPPGLRLRVESQDVVVDD